ncbi:hypothetical protein ACH4UM_31175 [Streptomyces sp. NPDC020801]|uniref:hypothetical protein n=1 Tax=unclassified Streptomyces TaxID=2593676 RepID=UPI0037AA5FBE
MLGRPQPGNNHLPCWQLQPPCRSASQPGRRRLHAPEARRSSHCPRPPDRIRWAALGPADFAEDIRFALDRIEDLDTGRNPDAEHRALPAGLRGAFDLHRIGMFGWSKGGTATARVMYEDQRVRAGLSLDGPMQPEVTADLERPFMLMTAEFTRAEEPSVAEFWSHLRRWRLNVRSAPAAPGAPARRPERGLPRGEVPSVKRWTAALTSRGAVRAPRRCVPGRPRSAGSGPSAVDPG